MPTHTGKYTLEHAQAERYTRMCIHAWTKKKKKNSQTTHTLYLSNTQTRTNNRRVLQGRFDFFFFFSLCPDEMFIISNTLREEKKTYKL